MVGVCIRRMDLCVPLGQFVMSTLCREVQTFRDEELTRLTALHNKTFPPGAKGDRGSPEKRQHRQHPPVRVVRHR